MQQPLTVRQRQVFDFLCESVRANGYAPSIDEIGKRFGLTSSATVFMHLETLKRKGYVRRAWNRSRATELLCDSNQCPTCFQMLPPSKA